MMHYKNLRTHLKGLIEVKQHQVDFQRNLVAILGKYEERNLIYSNESNNTKLILGGSSNELQREMQSMQDKMKNPFYNMLYWVKGEISDIKAMEDALHSRLNLTALM